MAILPAMIHDNPITSSLVIGAAAGGVAHFAFECDPLTSVGIGVGGALVTRGLIHLDAPPATTGGVRVSVTTTGGTSVHLNITKEDLALLDELTDGGLSGGMAAVEALSKAKAPAKAPAKAAKAN